MNIILSSNLIDSALASNCFKNKPGFFLWCLNWYANGGFPNAGELFMANEAGPELVGKMGNRNVVANNKQIVDGIRAGVFEAVVNAIESTKGTGNQDEQRPTFNVYVGGKKVTEVVVEEINKTTRSTGRCPIIT